MTTFLSVLDVTYFGVTNIDPDFPLLLSISSTCFLAASTTAKPLLLVKSILSSDGAPGSDIKNLCSWGFSPSKNGKLFPDGCGWVGQQADENQFWQHLYAVTRYHVVWDTCVYEILLECGTPVINVIIIGTPAIATWNSETTSSLNM